jgi:pimeloyl-ACP methyl ester carboxylesterase
LTVKIGFLILLPIRNESISTCLFDSYIYYARPRHARIRFASLPDCRARLGPRRPAGGATLVEKFRTWTDCDGDPETALTMDEMLTGITLYWMTGAIASSFWPYYARMHGPWTIPPGSTIDVPTGYAEFPGEILHPPRSLAERTYTDIRRWTVMAKGGHFAALEQPAALAEEIRAFSDPCDDFGGHFRTQWVLCVALKCLLMKTRRPRHPFLTTKPRCRRSSSRPRTLWWHSG